MDSLGQLANGGERSQAVPFLISLPAAVFMTAHIAMIVIQVVGSIWIKKLSPDWSA